MLHVLCLPKRGQAISKLGDDQNMNKSQWVLYRTLSVSAAFSAASSLVLPKQHRGGPTEEDLRQEPFQSFPFDTFKQNDKTATTMANLMMLRFPSSLRSFSVSASSSNGSPPVIGGSSGGVGPLIVELPLEKIRRPLMRTRSNDQNKVKELMDSIRQIGLQVPIDVIEVDGAYYGFSGCHRYEAHQKLGLPTIRCKIRKGTKETLRYVMYVCMYICVQRIASLLTLKLISFHRHHLR
ncbi:unnamed protein product [Brassica oleracea]